MIAMIKIMMTMMMMMKIMTTIKTIKMAINSNILSMAESLSLSKDNLTLIQLKIYSWQKAE